MKLNQRLRAILEVSPVISASLVTHSAGLQRRVPTIACSWHLSDRNAAERPLLMRFRPAFSVCSVFSVVNHLPGTAPFATTSREKERATFSDSFSPCPPCLGGEDSAAAAKITSYLPCPTLPFSAMLRPRWRRSAPAA